MDKDYADAMALVVKADRETTQTALDIVTALKAAHADAIAKLGQLSDEFADVGGPIVGAHLTVNTLKSQVAMLEFNVLNLVQTAQGSLSSYDPPVAMPMPVGTPQG